MDSKPVIIEEVLYASVDKVWEALTDKEKMKLWYFNIDKFEPEAGFIFRFAGKGHQGLNYLKKETKQGFG